MEETKENLPITTDTSQKFDHKTFVEKSRVLILNMKKQPDELIEIQVVQSIKYFEK